MSADADRVRVQAALVDHADDLRGFLTRRAGAALLRLEAPEDLYQGFASEVLSRANRFELRGRGSERAWLFSVAHNFLRDRQRHWAALKRGSGQLLRSGFGAPGSSRVGLRGDHLPSPRTGPLSLAARREELLLVAKALALLLPRDRDLVEWASQGLSNDEIGERLELTPQAAARARAKALERLRKTHELVLRRLSGAG